MHYMDQALGKNLSNFVPPTWKIDNPYYHHEHYANMHLAQGRIESVQVDFMTNGLVTDPLTLTVYILGQ